MRAKDERTLRGRTVTARQDEKPGGMGSTVGKGNTTLMLSVPPKYVR
jgi:hypothetical protein